MSEPFNAVPTRLADETQPGQPAFLAGAVHRNTDVDGVQIHSVSSGSGPDVVLVAGWPQWWWTWRHVMSALAPNFTVHAVDLRGQGASDKPRTGYDTPTVAAELHRWIELKGINRFVLVGHDVGAWVSYAYANAFRERLVGLVLLDALIPGLDAPRGGFLDDASNTKQFQFSFNRLPELPETLIRGHESEFMTWLFKYKSAKPERISDEVVEAFADGLRDREALRAGFDYYRALPITTAYGVENANQKLSMPVLTIGAGAGVGLGLRRQLATHTDDAEDATIEDCGHFLSEERPNEVARALEPFLNRVLTANDA